MTAIWTLARLTWVRIFRGKTIWITALLFVAPLVIAGATLASVHGADERWSLVAELTLRSLVLLAPVLHLSTAVAEENEGKTYTYLWSRPVPRSAVVLGKLVAVIPIVAVANLAALSLAWIIVGLGPGEMEIAWLGRALGGAAAGIVGASCFAVGIGALFPRHPLVVSLGYVFFAEQILPMVKAVQNVSTLYHVQNIAKMPRSPLGHDEEPAAAVLALAILSAIWLTLALWRIRRLEFGTADG